MTDFLEYHSRHLEAVAKANELSKPVIFDALAAAGVTRITVEFDGASDSGQINKVTAYAGDAPAELPSTSLTLHEAPQSAGDLRTFEMTLPDAIEELCYDYLSECQDGWENDDGAYGTFEFDVRDRSIHLDFNARFTQVDNSAYDF